MMKYNTNFCHLLDKSRLTYPFANQYKLALLSLNFKNLMFNNIKFKTFIHSSSILKSDILPQENLDRVDNINPQTIFADPTTMTQSNSPIIGEVARLENERLSNLKLVKYKSAPEKEEDDWPSSSSSSSENYPLISRDHAMENGLLLGHTHPISMFDGVKIISRFLEERYDINPELISKTKLTEILELFEKNGGQVTVEEIYEYLNDLYKKDPNFYTETLITETENLSEKLNSITEDSNTSKPFGHYGEVTLNQIGVVLKENLKHAKDINWELVYEKTKLTVHGAPVVANLVGYGLIIKSYMKYVHNRPMDVGITSQAFETQKILRNRQLGLFCIIGAPLAMLLLRSTAIPIKDMFTLTIGGESQVANSNSNSINSIIFLSYLNKKIPNWLKIFFKILFVTILVLKLLGFSFLSVFSINIYYIKVAYYIICSLIIFYHLLCLYLLHKIVNKNLKILEVLPEFVKKWIKWIEMLTTTKADRKEFKTNSYMEITVYLLLMIITIIITNLF